MRGFLFYCALFALAAIAPAEAQPPTSITLNATPIPIVEAQINNQPVRLEVDLRLPNIIAFNTATAERLGVQEMRRATSTMGSPGSALTLVNFSIDGGTRLRGRGARPRLVFPGGASRAFGGVFPFPVTSVADGVIGPGSLPYGEITVQLKPTPIEGREITIPIMSGNVWATEVTVHGLRSQILFDLSREETVFNTTAANRFDTDGTIRATGPEVDGPLILGLTTRMQPVTTGLTVFDLPLSTGMARIDAPLLGADEPFAIVVPGRASRPVPSWITVGRAALQSCDWLRVDRRARRMTLHCAV